MMKVLVRGLVLAVFVAVSLTWQMRASHAGDLKLGGTGGAHELLKLLAKTFAAENADVSVMLIPGLGSGGGIRAVGDGELDIAVSSRKLTPQELQKGLLQLELARTPFVLVSSNLKSSSIKSSEIGPLFANEKANWGDGSRVRIIIRPKADSDNLLAGEQFPGYAAASEKRRNDKDVQLAPTDQENADIAESLPGSLTFMALTQLKLEKRKLRAIAIDGVEPSTGNLENGIYRYARDYYLVHASKGEVAVEKFLAFVSSPKGAAILRTGEALPFSHMASKAH